MDLKKANMVAGSVRGTRNTSPVMEPSSANSLLTWRLGLIHSGQQTFINSLVQQSFLTPSGEHIFLIQEYDASHVWNLLFSQKFVTSMLFFQINLKDGFKSKGNIYVVHILFCTPHSRKKWKIYFLIMYVIYITTALQQWIFAAQSDRTLRAPFFKALAKPRFPTCNKLIKTGSLDGHIFDYVGCLSLWRHQR